MSLYAYCIGEEIDTDALDEIAGVQGSKTRVIKLDDLQVVVGDIGEARVPLTQHNVVAHQNVVCSVLGRVTPLPFRFGTVVSHWQLETYVRSNQGALLAGLGRVKGCVEMSVKIIGKPALVPEISKAPAESTPQDEEASGAGPGTSFLAEKRRRISTEQEQKNSAREISEWLDNSVSRVIRQSSVRLCPTRSLVLAASHLVERNRLDEYRECVKRAAEKRPEFKFLTSGAWPPYSFSALNP